MISGTANTGGLRTDIGRRHGAGGLEVRVCPLQLQVLVEDAEKAPEVSVAPFPPGTLALLDDRVDGPLRRRDVGHANELGPPEVLLARLGIRRPDEQALRAKPLGEVLKAGLDGPVELTDRVELLQVGNDLVVLVAGQRDRLRDGLEPFGVLDIHALGPLEECEVAEGCLAERHQLDADAGRKAWAGIGKLGRARRGAAPTAVSRFWTSARWSISWWLIPRRVLRQRWTAARESGVRPSPTDCLSENAANTYWSMTRCSSSAALPSV